MFFTTVTERLSFISCNVLLIFKQCLSSFFNYIIKYICPYEEEKNLLSYSFPTFPVKLSELSQGVLLNAVFSSLAAWCEHTVPCQIILKKILFHEAIILSNIVNRGGSGGCLDFWYLLVLTGLSIHTYDSELAETTTHVTVNLEGKKSWHLCTQKSYTSVNDVMHSLISWNTSDINNDLWSVKFHHNMQCFNLATKFKYCIYSSDHPEFIEQHLSMIK